MPAQKYVDKYTLKTLNMEPSGIPPNNSQQHLMDTMEAVPNLNPIEDPKAPNDRITFSEWCTVIILCFVNLINYMDRYTVAGVLDDIQKEFNADFRMGGLLQTAFVISYMIFAPLFGYMGDRYNRRYLMAFGVFFWSLTTLIGSFMPTYPTFLLFRSLVGIGEASYSTIAPTIISDIFVSDHRSKMLALFYFAIPVGSGMGYIVGSTAAHLGDNWRWGLRVTPLLGAVAVLLIIFVLVDPNRGEAEGKTDIAASSYKEDVISLATNKSFMFSTFGFTCVSFVTGALAWWGPQYIAKGEQLIRKSDKSDDTAIALVFGVIAMMSGVIGVPLGSVFATRLRPTCPKIDPILCSIGLFLSAPFIFIALCVADKNTAVVFFLVFLGEVALNLNWAIVADILLNNLSVLGSTHLLERGVPEERLATAVPAIHHSLHLFLFGISLIFGLDAMAAGVIGVPLGATISRHLRRYFSVKSDAYVCLASAIGALFFCIPFLLTTPYLGMQLYVVMFFGQVFLNMGWSVVVDIAMYVIVPPRRSTAEAFQILISHALGDAGSPYLVGWISDTLKGTMDKTGNIREDSSVTDRNDFKSLQYALFSTCFIEILGAVCFLVTSFYIVDDKAKAEAEMQSDGGAPTHMYADDPQLNCSEANLTTS